MEIVEGKLGDKKIVIAQEIAIAKVLSGNNKALRDRALKKLRKWLSVRGNGKLAFTEDDFIRIWTGLFYCMWMSDKFLVQEELAESISNLIHCFKKNSDSALLFVKCFNKRILMEWEGLDQYRIDKFNMLVRRFLRQTLEYCKQRNWDVTILRKLTNIFYNVVLHRDNSLGFVLHFISIYLEELAKVSIGKLQKETLTILIEPFVKLIANTRDDRIRKEGENFFLYLMRQTDVGIDHQEQFEQWRMKGYPGKSPNSLQKIEVENGDDDSDFSDDDEENLQDGPLDPRAGSVHVTLPQIPIDPEGMVNLFNKYKNSNQTYVKGRKLLKNLIQKYSILNKGKFPENIKKDSVLDKKTKKRKQVEKNALKLLKFSEKLDSDPIKTEELKELDEELQELSEDDVEDEEETVNESIEDEEEMEVEEPKIKKLKKKEKKKVKKKKVKLEKKKKAEIEVKKKEETESPPKAQKKKKNKKKKKKTEENIPNGSIVKETPTGKNGLKRKSILGNWQVQELDKNSPEYYKIETPKVIRIEKRTDDLVLEEKEEPEVETENKKPKVEAENKEVKESPVPAFWEKAKSKVAKKSKVFVNPFAEINGESKSSSLRRISFALERNMAQENEEYLEEVKNSPKVPFDGSKKPVQSALKSGLAPSPVNPFYRFKRIKF